MQSRHFFTTGAAVWGLLINTHAFAQSTCGEDTCPPGHTCEVESYENCNYACEDTPDGRGDCAATSCETEEYAYCQRAACETDADCGGSMVCHTFAASNCATPACAPGEDCVLVDVEPCTTEEYKQCTPRAELPCETAADCGEGYNCEEAVSCSCSGMGSGAPRPERQRLRLVQHLPLIQPTRTPRRLRLLHPWRLQPTAVPTKSPRLTAAAVRVAPTTANSKSSRAKPTRTAQRRSTASFHLVAVGQTVKATLGAAKVHPCVTGIRTRRRHGSDRSNDRSDPTG